MIRMYECRYDDLEKTIHPDLRIDLYTGRRSQGYYTPYDFAPLFRLIVIRTLRIGHDDYLVGWIAAQVFAAFAGAPCDVKTFADICAKWYSQEYPLRHPAKTKKTKR